MVNLSNIVRSLLIGLVAAVLMACATTGFNTQTYTVKSGDTLYFIAWKYKLDFKELAAWNALSEPYQIYPGDRLLIHPVEVDKQSRVAARSSKQGAHERTTDVYYVVTKGDSLYGIARRQGVSVSQIASLNNLKRPYTIYPGQRLNLRSSSRNVSAKPNVVVKRQTPVSRPGSKVVGKPNPTKWLWPTEGKIVRGFKGSKTTQQGIDIGGRMGQTVRATAAGEVVYSGSGLISYGQLVIVKHNETYLSAYGYNSQLLVKEGEKVKAGQAIAKMGRVGQQAPLLHFEIRKRGKPINPVGYLPKQG